MCVDIPENDASYLVIVRANNMFMVAGRDQIEVRAKALLRARERKAAEPAVKRILDILNFRAPETEDADDLWGDPRTGLDYETLFQCTEELVELMHSWLAAGCRLERWTRRKQFEDDLNQRKGSLWADRDGRVGYEFGDPVRELLDLHLSGYKYDPKPGRTEAVSLFFQFITGPFQRDIAWCKRCRKYFWNRSGHANKAYCNSRCASADTAERVTRERRNREHQAKLKSVQNAVQRFEQSTGKRSRLDWKPWVKRQCGPDVTLHFITRAINRGEIMPPKMQ